MRTVVVTKLQHGHAVADKMDKAVDTFQWPGMNREKQEKSDNCPSCRAAGKNLKKQIPRTELKRLDLLTEPNQEIQLDFADPIKSKIRGEVYVLVAIDRFRK